MMVPGFLKNIPLVYFSNKRIPESNTNLDTFHKAGSLMTSASTAHHSQKGIYESWVFFFIQELLSNLLREW